MRLNLSTTSPLPLWRNTKIISKICSMHMPPLSIRRIDIVFPFCLCHLSEPSSSAGRPFLKPLQAWVVTVPIFILTYIFPMVREPAWKNPIHVDFDGIPRSAAVLGMPSSRTPHISQARFENSFEKSTSHLQSASHQPTRTNRQFCEYELVGTQYAKVG